MGADGMMRNLFAGVNVPGDPDNLTDLEKRHVPSLFAPPAARKDEFFPVTVEVGMSLAHPNDRGHFVQFIDLFADQVFLLRVDLTPGTVAPKVTVHVALSAPAQKLRALARCNLHGLWAGETDAPSIS